VILKVLEYETVPNPTLGDWIPLNPKKYQLFQSHPDSPCDISDVISEYSPCGTTLALALNFESRQANQVLIFLPKSQILLRTDVSREYIACIRYLPKGDLVLCLTRDEKLIILTTTGLHLNCLSGPVPGPWLNLRTLYDMSKIAITVGKSFLSLSCLGNEIVCSNGSVVFHLSLPQTLGQDSLDLAHLILMRSQLILKRMKQSGDGTIEDLTLSRNPEPGVKESPSAVKKFVTALDGIFFPDKGNKVDPNQEGIYYY
jgi:hypothetical protein